MVHAWSGKMSISKGFMQPERSRSYIDEGTRDINTTNKIEKICNDYKQGIPA
jgi:hypothetical protein